MNIEWLLTHIVEFALTAICGGLVVYIRGLHKKYTAMEDGIKALLRSSIFEAYRYYKSKGFIEPEDRTMVAETYTAYHNLGGDDVATDIYNKIRQLPTEDTKEPGYVEEETKK